MRLKNLTALACAGIFAATVATPVVAQSMMKMGDDAIAERQALMKSNGGTLKGAGSASGADAVAAGEKLVANFTALKDLWPDDSMGGNSKTKPEAWNADGTLSDGFVTALNNSIAASEALIVAANSGDAEAYGAAVKGVGGTCFACHSAYQVKQ